jgi:hypothetical protein
MRLNASFLAGITLAWLAAPDSSAAEPARSQASAIGKPFRVSDSVTRFCATRPIVPMCEAFAPRLAELLAEPRDARWAAPVEALIARSMLVDGKPWVQIRALECRRTLCALEYAVPADDLDHDVDGNAELEQFMEPVSGVVVPEPASGPGKSRMVSVLIWLRRS